MSQKNKQNAMSSNGSLKTGKRLKQLKEKDIEIAKKHIRSYPISLVIKK
jgi:hypothetical protein